jgi:WD40 repeat protein
MFVAGGVHGTVMVCSAIDGERLRTLTAHSYAIHDMALSRDGCWLLTASDDATARVFSLLDPAR